MNTFLIVVYINIYCNEKQHRSDVESKKADSEISGISKHARYCTYGKINWETPEILQVEKEKSKFSPQKISW